MLIYHKLKEGRMLLSSAGKDVLSIIAATCAWMPISQCVVLSGIQEKAIKGPRIPVIPRDSRYVD